MREKIGPSLSELIELLGADRTVQLVRRFGGDRWYVPKGADRLSGGVITAFFTAEELTALSRRWGGVAISLPIARGFCACFLHRVKGLTVTDIRRILRMTEKGVHDALRRDFPGLPPARAA